jgi:hypothetical protein
MLRALVAVLSLVMAAGAVAQLPSAETKKPAAKTAAKPKSGVRPAWAELTADQQRVLAPLKPDWDALEAERRQKWVAIAKRFPKMKPEEQERVTRRMQAWAKLTPEQRRAARENYKRIAKVPRQERNLDLRQEWAEYQALPPHERQSLVPTPSTDPRRQK